MRSLKLTLHSLAQQRRLRRFRLPWAELEAEARRQGCSPADIFFDRAGRTVPGLSPLLQAPVRPQADGEDDDHETGALQRVPGDIWGRAGGRPKLPYNTWGRPI